MKRYLTFALALIVIGCSSTKYNVYEISSNNVKNSDTSFSFVNEDIIVDYGFWDYNGVMSFRLTNISDKPIYIDWKKSSFIINGKKLDYWKDTETTTGESYGAQYMYTAGTSKYAGSTNASQSGNRISGNSYGESKSQSSSVGLNYNYSVERKEKPERITFIPPKSFITMSKFMLKAGLSSVNKNEGVSKDTTFNDENYNYKLYQLTPATTIGSYRNFLTYSKFEDFRDEKFLDNDFWISKVLVMPVEQFVTVNTEYIDEESHGRKYKKRIYIYDEHYIQPNRFYIKWE